MKEISNLERLPPQSLEAEQSVLGSMLQEGEAITKAVEFLRADYFYREAHRLIFAAIIELYNRGEPADLITVVEILKSKDQLEAIGGTTYLATLINGVPTSANVEYYAKIVEEKAMLRSLISAGTQIVNWGYEGEGQADTTLDKAEKIIFSISQRGIHQYFHPIKEVVDDLYDSIDQKYSEKGIIGLPTGFADLDGMTSGLQPSDLIIIAGRTAMGKTSLALNIAQNVSIRERIPVAIFSLEMSKEQLALRMLCSEGNVNAHRLRSARLEESDWPRLTRAMGVLSPAPIFIDDTSNISCAEVRGKARRLKAEHKELGLIIVDYLQLMQGRGLENRVQEISEISRSLKSLARELSVPVLALSQLSRAVEKRDQKRPQLSDLRESGSIEQDADLVAFIYREQYYKSLSKGVAPETEEEMVEETEIIIAKQRNGPTGSFKIGFEKNYTKFVNLERYREEEE
ncbi:MAG: replicative DNA helicase [Armatimonadetes bacterium CG07_land_8_20_14_0_80_40_9]|nr:MAG: replicative DNA helicase [Armatimonadetes bacterium CG07_land_8_20_14_0_80_40_9]